VSNADMELYQRLSQALGTHDVDPNVKGRIQQAYLDVDGTGGGFAALPKDIQDQIVQIESTPAQAWEDPSDVPDEIYEA
jgi:hypothetical protein